MKPEEQKLIEWLVAESSFVMQVADQHRIKLAQLQAILAWEQRREDGDRQSD